MSLADVWYRFKLLHLSKPAGERLLYRSVRGRKIRTLLEVGIGDGERTKQLLSWLKHQGTLPERYAAIDPFESGGPSNITLKAAHRLINSFGIKPCFVPGEFANAALRVIHTVGPCDLVILSSVDQHPSKHLQTADLISRLVADAGMLIARNDSGAFEVVPRPNPAVQTRRAA